MLKKYFTITFLLIFSIAKSQIVNIPDDNFKNALLNQSPTIDLNNDNEIQISEATSYNQPIDVSNYTFDFNEMIFDFTGIEAFTNMSEFYASGHDFYNGNFNFSFNPSITVIDISYCSANQIDISKNNNLIELNISGVQINTIDVTHLINLEILTLRHTTFSTIDLSQNINLRELSFFAGNINSINLSNNLALEVLRTGGAPLILLDLTNNINLIKLEIQGSNYSAIDLSQNINLEHIACYGSNVLNFDLSNNINLKSFGCGNNLFTSLDLSNNINLERFVSQGNDNLETINLKNGNNSNFSYFEALRHPNLTTVCVDNVDYAVNNFTNIDNSDVYSTCSKLSTVDNEFLNNVKIYPNPIINNTLYIQLNSLIQVEELSIIDLSGRTIKTGINNLKQNNNRLSINTEFINSNIFFLKLRTNKGLFLKKVIKK